MAKAVVHQPGDGRTVRSGDDTVTVKLEPPASGHGFSVVEYTLAPGSGPGQHAHADSTESYVVLEGELVFRLGPARHVLQTGSFVHVPQGIVHGFRNESDAPVRLLWLFYPAASLAGMGWH